MTCCFSMSHRSDPCELVKLHNLQLVRVLHAIWWDWGSSRSFDIHEVGQIKVVGSSDRWHQLGLGISHVLNDPRRSGGWFNIKTPPYQYRDSHYKDKTVSWPSYLYNGNSYTGKQWMNCHYKDDVVVRLSYLDNGNSYTGKMTSEYWICLMGHLHWDMNKMVTNLRLLFQILFFWGDMFSILIEISLKLVSKGPVDNKSSLVQ